MAQTFNKHRESYVMQNEGRSFYYGRKDAADAVNAMLPVVDGIARPGDKLFVGTGDLRKTPYSEAFLYYLLARRNYPEYQPVVVTHLYLRASAAVTATFNDVAVTPANNCRPTAWFAPKPPPTNT